MLYVLFSENIQRLRCSIVTDCNRTHGYEIISGILPESRILHFHDYFLFVNPNHVSIWMIGLECHHSDQISIRVWLRPVCDKAMGVTTGSLFSRYLFHAKLKPEIYNRRVGFVVFDEVVLPLKY